MAITYNVGSNTITVTGYTEAVPCTFLNVYNADVAGGWGVVSRQCSNQYCFDCLIDIGNGVAATWFADENVQVKLKDLATAHNQNILNIKRYAHFRLGKLDDDAKKLTSNGCQLYVDSSTWQVLCGTINNVGAPDTEIELYSFCMKGNPAGYGCYFHCIGAIGKVYNSLFSDYASVVIGNVNLYNATIAGGRYGVGGPREGIYDKIGLYAAVWGFEMTTDYNITIKNVVARDVDYIIRASTINNHYLINVDSDAWVCQWVAGNNGKVYRQYEFDLKVIQENAARTAIANRPVKIWDLADTLVCDTTTDANGEIATQTLNYGYYTRLNGSTATMLTPHKIVIDGGDTDFLTVTKYMYMDYERKEVISMVDMADILALLNSLDEGHDDILTEVMNEDQYKADVSDLAKIWDRINKGKGSMRHE